MKTSLDLAQARNLLRTREDLLETGHAAREIRALVADRRLIRVRRDRYIDATAHDDLWGEGRHLVAVVAAHLNADPPGPVFWGPSAAVLLGLPLYRLSPDEVHTVVLGARHGRTRAHIVQHGVPLDDTDIVDVGGLRCTSLERTVLDLACTTSPGTALAAADAALRRVAVERHHQDPDRATDWHRRMSLRAAAVRSRGVRRARWILDFADGRAQLPGESVSRLHLHRIGFTGLELQPHVVGSEGDHYWMDFGFPRKPGLRRVRRSGQVPGSRCARHAARRGRGARGEASRGRRPRRHRMAVRTLGGPPHPHFRRPLEPTAGLRCPSAGVMRAPHPL